MKKSLFFTLNIGKYQNFLIKILVLAFIFIANKGISQVYTSDSSTITIGREAYISDNSQTIKAQIYITKGTKTANSEAFSNSEIIYITQQKEEFKNSKQLFTSDKTQSSKKIDGKPQQPKKNHLESEFKKWDNQTAFLTINSILGSSFTVTQYQNTFFINAFTDKIIFQFFNNKRKNTYSEKEKYSVGISIVFKTRPPPFYS